MRPIHVNAPVGTIVNPVLPAACGARGVVGYRVYDAVMGALAQVVPDKVVAPGEGGPSLIAIGGYQDGRPFVLAEVLVGCWGARAARDGLEGCRTRSPTCQPARRAARERPAAAGARLRARRRLRRPRTLPRRPRLRALVRAARRRSGADRAVRSTRAPAVRVRGRRGRGAIVEHDPLVDGERSVPTMPMEALTAAPGRRLPPRLGRRRRQRLAVRARPGARARGRARGEGGVEAARERYGVVIAEGKVDDARREAALELRPRHSRRHGLRRHRRGGPRRRRRRQGRSHSCGRRARAGRPGDRRRPAWRSRPVSSTSTATPTTRC